MRWERKPDTPQNPVAPGSCGSQCIPREVLELLGKLRAARSPVCWRRSVELYFE